MFGTPVMFDHRVPIIYNVLGCIALKKKKKFGRHAGTSNSKRCTGITINPMIKMSRRYVVYEYVCIRGEEKLEIDLKCIYTGRPLFMRLPRVYRYLLGAVFNRIAVCARV